MPARRGVAVKYDFDTLAEKLTECWDKHGLPQILTKGYPMGGVKDGHYYLGVRCWGVSGISAEVEVPKEVFEFVVSAGSGDYRDALAIFLATIGKLPKKYEEKITFRSKRKEEKFKKEAEKIARELGLI